MKIGILTFHNAHNFGGCLQAFALKEFFKFKGADVTIINYRNPKVYNLYPKKLKVKINPYDYKHPRELIKKIKLKRDYRFGKKEWKRQHQKFTCFIDNYLLEGNQKVIEKSEIKDLNFDVFVAGSDQIWNKQLTGGLDHTYLLDFDTKAKKVFYAASAGSDEIDETDFESFKNVFSNENKYVSVREPTLAEYISKRYGRNVLSAVDPCFLLTSEQYINLFSLDKNKDEKRKRYLFAYFISERNKIIREMVYVIANALGLEIVEFHYRKGRDMNKKYQTSDMGPEEFLKCIYNADFVVTNSFHGTVFSILFKKQFYSVYDTDARKTNLLDKMGLSNRHIKNFSDINLNKVIDFKDISLEEYAKSSKDFLSQMVKEYEK